MSLIDSNKLLSWIDDQARTDADEDRYRLIREKIMDLMESPQNFYPKAFIDKLHGMSDPDYTNRMYKRFLEGKL